MTASVYHSWISLGLMFCNVASDVTLNIFKFSKVSPIISPKCPRSLQSVIIIWRDPESPLKSTRLEKHEVSKNIHVSAPLFCWCQHFSDENNDFGLKWIPNAKVVVRELSLTLSCIVLENGKILQYSHRKSFKYVYYAYFQDYAWKDEDFMSPIFSFNKIKVFQIWSIINCVILLEYVI